MDIDRHTARMTPDPANPYGIQVNISPGGLSSTAHLINVIVTICTGGLWLPVYLVMYAAAPVKRVQVLAPVGTPLEAVNAAHAQASELTPGEATDRRRTFLVVGILIGGVVALCLGAWVWGALSGK